jgi:hypothetical protein
MATTSLIQMIPAIVATCSLSACGMSSPQSNSPKVSMSPVAQSQPNKFVGGWIIAPQKHNNSGIELRYKLGSQPKAGQPVTVELEFSGVAADDAHIQMRLDPALAPSATAALQKNADGFRLPLSKSQANTQMMTVTPNADGMYFIQMQMTQAGRTSAASIAIQVGDGPVATPTLGEVQTTPSGERIIMMPAAK